MIREVEERDLGNVRTMIERAIAYSVARTKEEAEFLTADVNESLEKWRTDPQDSIHLLEERDGKVAGAILVKKYWNLCDLFVDPEEQRKGIGRSLLDAVVPLCRERSPKGKLMVNSSTVGVPFYKDYGFVQTGPGIERAGGCVPLELVFVAANDGI